MTELGSPIAGTGRTIGIVGFGIFEVAEGVIKVERLYLDAAALMIQLGPRGAWNQRLHPWRSEEIGTHSRQFGDGLSCATIDSVSEESKGQEPTAAETIGRTAGLLTKLAVRQALKLKTVRDQVRDARAEASAPVDKPPEDKPPEDK